MIELEKNLRVIGNNVHCVLQPESIHLDFYGTGKSWIGELEEQRL